METLEQLLMAGPVPSDSVRQGLTAVITEQDGLNQVTASPGGVCVCVRIGLNQLSFIFQTLMQMDRLSRRATTTCLKWETC